MSAVERPLCFSCDGSLLYGIASLPDACAARGVLIVVGGPQYRAGSHRQFTLLARHLAASGIASLRFDYRGMGDSEGAERNFEGVENDLRSAIDAFIAQAPQLKEIVIWGLCDAASAALFYGYRDNRVKGLVLLNPWVRTEAGIARTYMKHYYAARLFDAGFWKKVLRGKLDYSATARSFLDAARTTIGAPRSSQSAAVPGTPKGTNEGATEETNKSAHMPLPDRMYHGFSKFRGHVLLILSANDLTASEFKDVAHGSPKWRALLASPSVACIDVADANHTFARREWRDKVALITSDWIWSW